MPSNESERMRILEMIDRGVITPGEGLALLSALDGAEPALPEGEAEAALAAKPFEAGPEMPPPPSRAAQGSATADTVEASGAPPASPGDPGQGPVQGEVLSPPAIGPDFSRWRQFWQIPLWVGAGITIVAGILMFLAWQGSGFGFWFACTWLPFMLGVAVMALAWGTRSMPWLHLRVSQKEGQRPQRIAISLPLPLGLISWALRTFKHKIPGTGNVNIDEMVMALKHVTPDAPLSVDVNEGEDGERVQIYIG